MNLAWPYGQVLYYSYTLLQLFHIQLELGELASMLASLHIHVHNYFPVVSCCILYDLGTGLRKSNLSMAHISLPLLLLLTLSLLFPPQNVVCHHWDVLCCAIVPCCGTSPCFEIAPCRETVLNHSLPSSPSSLLSLLELCTYNTETVN